MQRNEKLKQLNTKLEAINIDLEQFAYAASHDLREPLRMIGAFTGLLERRYLANLDEEGNEYLNYIKDGTKRMSNLIGQILAYSKLENVENSNQAIDLNFLIKEISKDLQLLIKEKHANIILNLPKEPVIAQPQRMKMLFYNLIS